MEAAVAEKLLFVTNQMTADRKGKKIEIAIVTGHPAAGKVRLGE